ncbi:hypothetical protein DSCA_49070 [Desulfosarcina alkanivorans]|uniref:Uncharacterized protein n=1 Tax=Desulfosarcina alkanivorans TaxID=571177 RepID=A0A5K7Z2V0_9BACT|nr:hypothetical protein [Desulfosarcina alkanivorans]BBO70977.1 hypothetical protein DSCA_49070 [Desulfosarcina alkanivorans]
MIENAKYCIDGLPSDAKEGTNSRSRNAMQSRLVEGKTKAVPRQCGRDENPAMYEADAKAFGAKSLNR